MNVLTSSSKTILTMSIFSSVSARGVFESLVARHRSTASLSRYQCCCNPELPQQRVSIQRRQRDRELCLRRAAKLREQFFAGTLAVLSSDAARERAPLCESVRRQSRRRMADHSMNAERQPISN